MSWFNIAQEIAPQVQAGDIEPCIERLKNEMTKLPDSPFHMATVLDFTNSPKEVASHFEKFIAQESTRLPLRAIYAETNGFDINPDRWFFDVFAYDTYGGHDDYGWLAEWKSDSYPSMTLAGMESLQRVYAREYVGDSKHGDAPHYASFLVLLKFQKLIKSSAPLIGNLQFPLLATSHDYDVIFEFNP